MGNGLINGATICDDQLRAGGNTTQKSPYSPGYRFPSGSDSPVGAFGLNRRGSRSAAFAPSQVDLASMSISPSDHPTNRSATGASGLAAPPRDGDAFERAYRRAKRHSRRVRLLKVALPALGLLLVAGVGLYSFVGLPGGLSVNLGGTTLEGGRLVMANPELDGYTPDNRPYSMRAERATQAIGNTNVIHLEKIGARLPIDLENWVEVDAEAGVFDREANTLELSDGVIISMDTGMTANLRSAMVDIGLGVMSTSEPVEITMSGSRLSADSMRVAERGGVLIFENRVRMEVDMQRLEQAQTSEESVNAQ